MWWHRRRNAIDSAKDVMIKARLKKGETLRITFPGGEQVSIEGWGQVRLRVHSGEEVAAEMLHSD